jgi:hypothetical protein
MIGRISLSGGVVATLEDDGVWSCDADGRARVLNSLFSPVRTTKPQVSRALPGWGRREVEAAAAFYGVAPEWPPADAVEHSDLLF